MKFLLLLLILLTWPIVSSNSVLACQCGESGTPVCVAYWGSDAVFVGQLRDITPRRNYANRESGSSQLLTGACSRTVDLQHADEDLSYIRSLMQNGVTESVAGRLTRRGYEVMSGVKIEVKNEKRTFETTTDEKGHFSVSLAGPGSYSVRLLPSSALAIMRMSAESSVVMVESTDVLTTIEYKVELGKSHCDYREFDLFPVDLHATAEVSGAVLTASGQPVEKGSVYLQRRGSFQVRED